MSTFLQLCQRVRQEAGIAGTGPSSVAAQTGELKRVVDWTADAWMMIANKQLWDWLWEQATVTITAGTSLTAGAIPVQRYLPDTAYIGDTPLEFVAWADFKREHPTVTQAGEPTQWSIRPDGAFVVDYLPETDTDITVERYALPTALTADADVPDLPTRFHMAIVWKALMEAADYDEAGVTRATAKVKYAEVLGDAFGDAITPITLGGALC